MANTTFVDSQTPVVASWLNDVNDLTYSKQFPDGSIALTDQSPVNPVDASEVSYLPNGSGAVETTVQNKLREYVSVDDFGAVGDGITNDSAAFAAALAASNTVFGSAGKTYYISNTVTVNNNKTLIGNGATIKGATGYTSTTFLVSGNDVTVKDWNINANGALYSFSNTGKRNLYSENRFYGNVGHYIFDNASTTQTQVIGNFVNGRGLDRITTSFVFENSTSFTASNNTFVDIENWCIQVRGGNKGNVSNNNCYATRYANSVTASAGQTVFNFTISNPCHLAGIQVDGIPIDTGITFSPTVPAANPTTNWTVTFSVAPGAGKVVTLIAFRAAENIQINNASSNITVIGNVCDGSGDSGIIVAGLSTAITITGNTVRNISYSGIVTEGSCGFCTITGNIVENTSLVTTLATYSSGILISGEWTVVSDNIIVNKTNPNTMKYGISINSYADDDGSTNASVKIGPNTYKSYTQQFTANIFMPNDDASQRRQNILILDGITTQYPEQVNLDSAWTNAPTDTNYWDYSFFGSTGAVRDTTVKQGGVASLQTVAGEYVDMNPTADGILKNTIVNVTFWAKNNSGSAVVTAFLTIGGVPFGSPQITITDTSWKQYSMTFPVTSAIDPSGFYLRFESTTGTANFQYIQLSMMNFA